jgi:hypothetical protein
VNPTGRAPGGAPLTARAIRRWILHETRDGNELVERLLELARWEATTPERARIAMTAIEMLLDRVAGKAAQGLHLTGSVDVVHTHNVNTSAIEALSDEEARALEDRLRALLPATTAEDAETVG